MLRGTLSHHAIRREFPTPHPIFSLSFPHALTKVLPAQVSRAARSWATSQMARRVQHAPRRGTVKRSEVIFGLSAAKQGFETLRRLGMMSNGKWRVRHHDLYVRM